MDWTRFERHFNGKKLTLTAVDVLGVGHKPYVYTRRRTRFLDEFGKKLSLMVRRKKERK
jgi:hypothetical protein